METDFTWASGERIEFIACLRQWLRDLRGERQAWAGRIARLRAYDGPNAMDALRLAAECLPFDAEAARAVDACLDAYASALNPARRDAEVSAEMNMARALLAELYRAASAELAVRVYRWLKERAAETVIESPLRRRGPG